MRKLNYQQNICNNNININMTTLTYNIKNDNNISENDIILTKITWILNMNIKAKHINLMIQSNYSKKNIHDIIS